MNTIDYYLDFTDPYACLSNMQLPELTDRFGYSTNYLPIDLKAAKIAAGNTGPATAQIPPKFQYARQDLQRRITALF